MLPGYVSFAVPLDGSVLQLRCFFGLLPYGVSASADLLDGVVVAVLGACMLTVHRNCVVIAVTVDPGPCDFPGDRLSRLVVDVCAVRLC